MVNNADTGPFVILIRQRAEKNPGNTNQIGINNRALIRQGSFFLFVFSRSANLFLILFLSVKIFFQKIFTP